jgi:glycerol-3-phosphate dehydrogenase
LEAVFRFHDAQTDDALLTRAVLHSAQSMGAELALPARFVAARMVRDGLRVEYERAGAAQAVSAAALVNAAGPWVGAVRAAIEPAGAGPTYELVQGAHIELEGRLERGIYYVEAPQDGRPVFLMPWNGRVLAGTTETPFRGDPGHVRPLESEQAYLAAVAAAHFPRMGAQPVGAFAGLRVLPAGAGSLGARSRETAIDVDHPHRPRVAHIYGGKLTTYRATAARVMDRLAALRPARRPLADTRELRLEPPA